MPTRTIEHQHHMHTSAGRLGDHPQVRTHQIGVHRRCDQRRTRARVGVHCAEDVPPLVLGLPDRPRPRAALAPDASQRALLADARLVLEPDFDALFCVFMSDILDKKGARSTHCPMACGSLLRCTGRGESTTRCSLASRS